MAFDGVPIGISDGLPKNRRFCLGRRWVSGCPGLENALGAVEMVLVPLTRSTLSYGTVKLSRICPFCGRILLDQRLRINDLAVAAGGENAAKLLNLTVP